MYPVTQKYPRYQTELAVEVLHTKTRAVEQLSLVNISLGGVFVRTLRAARAGSVLALRMNAGGTRFGATARVIHVIDAHRSVEKGHPPGMGLEFERLRPPAREALRRYVEELARAVQTASGACLSTTASLPEGGNPERTLDALWRGHVAPGVGAASASTSGTLQLPDAVMALVRRVFSGLDRGDIDGALGLELDATYAQRLARIERLLDLFASPPKGATVPQVARLEAAQRALTAMQQRMAKEQARGAGALLPEAGSLVRIGEGIELGPSSSPELGGPSPALRVVRERREALILLESAEACLCAGVDDRARESAMRAATLCPSTDIRVRALRALARAGAVKEAVRIGRELVAAAPDEPSAWEALLNLYEDNGMLRLAASAADSLVALRPKDARLKARLKRLRAQLT